MKGLKPADLRSWSNDELKARVTELEEERFRLQFRSATEALEGGAALRIRAIRKDVARLHTVMNEKKRAAGSGQGAAVAKTARKGAAK